MPLTMYPPSPQARTGHGIYGAYLIIYWYQCNYFDKLGGEGGAEEMSKETLRED